MALGHDLRPARPLDGRPRRAARSPGDVQAALPAATPAPRPAAGRGRRARARRPACATTAACRRPWPHAPARCSPPSSRRCHRSTRATRRASTGSLARPTLDARVAARTDDPSRAARSTARCRCSPTTSSRRRRSRCASPRRPGPIPTCCSSPGSRPPVDRCTAARRSSSAPLLRDAVATDAETAVGRAAARRRSACPGSGTRSTRVPTRGRRCSSTRSSGAGRPASSGAPRSRCARGDGQRRTGRTPTSTSRSVCSPSRCTWSTAPARRSSRSPAAQAGSRTASRSTSTGSATGSAPPTPARSWRKSRRRDARSAVGATRRPRAWRQPARRCWRRWSRKSTST